MEQFGLDESQKAVINAWAENRAVSVFGAPGTGKTFTLRALVHEQLAKNPFARIAVLTTNRRNATELRNQLSIELGGLQKNIQVRSLTAFAFEIVAQFAQLSGRKPPELITGPDQDAILKEAFEIALSDFPSKIDLTLTGIPNISTDIIELAAFRADFRDLITRANELQLSAQDLKNLAQKYDLPIWELGAQLLETYEKMLASAAGIVHAHADQVDHARLTTLAAQNLKQWNNANDPAIPERNQLGIPQWELVLVDDIQNAPLSILELLRALQSSGAKIVTFGDPDAGVEGYRGGVPHLPMLLARSWQQNGIGAMRRKLQLSHRVFGDIAVVASRIQQAIHTAGGGTHRKALSVFADHLQHENKAATQETASEDVSNTASNVCAQTFVNERAQIAFIANKFKYLHLSQKISYADMAIITRSAAEHNRLRRILEEFQIPVEPAISSLPLREAPLVRELIALISLSIGYELKRISVPITQILAGRLFGYSDLIIRRIIRQLHGWELLSGGMRSGEELLQSIVINPEAEIYTKIPELQKISAVISVIKEVSADFRNAQEALWKIWDALQLAEKLQTQALNGGEIGDLADEQLDAIMQLFRFTQRLVEREGENTSLQNLLALLEVQDLPEDSIAKSGNKNNQISLTTAASAVSKTWKYVAIINLNDGSWPNTRMRNPLTQVPKLSSLVIHSLVAGADIKPRSLLSEVIDDELRMFLVAVTRASHQLFLFGVESAEANASAFLHLVTDEEMLETETGETETGEKQEQIKIKPIKESINTSQVQSDIANLHENEIVQAKIVLKHCTKDVKVLKLENEIGKLRLVARHGSPQMQNQAAELISVLQNSYEKNLINSTHLQCAEWIDELEISNEAEISGKPVISPSKVEKYLECPLFGFYDEIGARADDDANTSREVGSLIHKICELYPDGGYEIMAEKLDSMLPEYFPKLNEIKISEIRTDLLKMLKNYDEYAQKFAGMPKYTELPAKYLSENFDIHARIDRLEYNPEMPDEVAVVDFKTGKSYPTKAEAAQNAQLRIYQWLIEKGCVIAPNSGVAIKKSNGANLFFVRKPLDTALYAQEALNDTQISEVTAELEKVAKDSKGPYFLAQTESKLCTRCVFNQLCPEFEGKRVFS